MNQGTLQDPLSLSAALATTRIQPGHTVWLLPGTHQLTTNTTATRAGAIYKPEAGPLTATIDLTGAQVADGYGDDVTAQNNLYLDGATMRLENLIILSAPMTRVTPTRGLYPMGFGRLQIRAASPPGGGGQATLKRCIIGNLLDLTSFGVNAGGVVTEDTIYYDNGWDCTETGDGEHFYTQNLLASPLKIFRRNLFGRCFGLAVQLYTEGSGRNANYLFEDITTLSNVYALAGEERNDVTYRRFLSWKNHISLGSGDPLNTDLALIDCYVAGSDLILGAGTGQTYTGNTVVKVDGAGEASIGQAGGAIAVNNNHYYGAPTLRYNNTVYSWSDWQNVLGFDANGTYSADLPPTNAVFVVPSDGTGYVLGQVTVYNWESLNSVTVDLATLGVTNGQQVKLRSIDDPLVDVRTLTVSGTSVTIDMTIYDELTNPTGRTISIPTGHNESLPPAMDVRFGAWRVEVFPA